MPPSVAAEAATPGAASFTVAREAPTVELALADDLTPDKALHPWWSAWGDLCVARDGRVYFGIGDHGDCAAGTAKLYLYRWEPDAHRLSRVLDANALVKRERGEPAFSKVHGRIDEGRDGRLYFTATLNDGAAAGEAQYKWSEALPGGQLYAYDPATDRAEIVANLPARKCSLSCRLDAARNVWWCNLDGNKTDAMWAYDLTQKREVFRSAEGVVAANRCFVLARGGAVWFNGKDSVLWRVDPAGYTGAPTLLRFPESQFMRCATDPDGRGVFYGVTAPEGLKTREFNLFRCDTAAGTLEMLGREFTSGHYTTVCVLSPDEKRVYYIPSAPGAPVVQYDVALNQRKVIAFLDDVLSKGAHFAVGSVFGLKMTPDGSVLYAHTNGSCFPDARPANKAEMAKVGRPAPAFLAIHIPAQER